MAGEWGRSLLEVRNSGLLVTKVGRFAFYFSSKFKFLDKDLKLDCLISHVCK